MEKISEIITIDEKIRTSDVLTTCSFDTLMISSSTVTKLLSNGFRLPSPIQEKAIPAGLSGLDLLVQAKSGTGKTLVFSVMAVENLNLQCSTPQRLILAPTREIACQIRDTILKIIPKFARVVVLVGGNSVAEDIQSLKKCHIVVGTTGRVCHLVQQGFLKLNAVDLFVLDEADKLMEDCFEKDINYLFSCIPETRQVAVFSATYPGSLDTMLSEFMKDVTLVRLNSDDVQLVGIKQYVYNCDEDEKETLLHLCENISFNQMLVFCNRIVDCQKVADLLVSKGYEACCISSQMTQAEREVAIQNLKSRKIKILVSSDLTARGVDAEHVNIVVNLEPAINVETYLHRIGRAARFGGIGAAITILKDKLAVKQFNKLFKDGNLKVRQLSSGFPSDFISVSKFFEQCAVYKKPAVVPSITTKSRALIAKGSSYTREELMRLRYVSYPMNSDAKQAILKAQIGTGALSDFKGDLLKLGNVLDDKESSSTEPVTVAVPKKKYTFVPVRAKAKKKFYLRGELLSIRESHSSEVWKTYAAQKFDMTQPPFVQNKEEVKREAVVPTKSIDELPKKGKKNAQKSNVLKYSRKEMINIQMKISKQTWVKYVKQNWDTTQEPFQLDPYLRCPFDQQLRRIRLREKNEREKILNERKKEVGKASNMVTASSRSCSRTFVTAKSFDDFCTDILNDLHKFSDSVRRGPVVAFRRNPADWNRRILEDSQWLHNFEDVFNYDVRKSSQLCAEVQCGNDEELLIGVDTKKDIEAKDEFSCSSLQEEDLQNQSDSIQPRNSIAFEDEVEDQLCESNECIDRLEAELQEAQNIEQFENQSSFSSDHDVEYTKIKIDDARISELGDVLSSYLYLSTRFYS